MIEEIEHEKRAKEETTEKDSMLNAAIDRNQNLFQAPESATSLRHQKLKERFQRNNLLEDRNFTMIHCSNLCLPSRENIWILNLME